jgi:hypothetical protein
MLRTSLNQYAVTHLKFLKNMTGRAANRNIVVTLTMMQIMDMTP